MQALSALVLSAALAAAAPGARQGGVRADAAAGGMGEAYVAELDADWNVTREIRVACPAQAGCAVDLALAHAGFAAVHVRFDAMRGGAVAVRSRLEGPDGRASEAEDKVLDLDRTGFGADHYAARLVPGAPDGPVIMMAVKVPGWTAPAPGAPAAGAPT